MSRTPFQWHPMTSPRDLASPQGPGTPHIVLLTSRVRRPHPQRSNEGASGNLAQRLPLKEASRSKHCLRRCGRLHNHTRKLGDDEI